MTVGLPGSGVGGIFYLLCALWMPLHRLLRRGRDGHGSADTRLIVRQASIAAGMIGVLFATGLVLGWLLSSMSGNGAVSVGTTVATQQATPVLRTAVLLLTAGVLGMLLIGVEVASLLFRARSRRVAATPSLPAPAPERHAA